MHAYVLRSLVSYRMCVRSFTAIFRMTRSESLAATCLYSYIMREASKDAVA